MVISCSRWGLRQIAFAYGRDQQARDEPAQSLATAGVYAPVCSAIFQAQTLGQADQIGAVDAQLAGGGGPFVLMAL